MENISKTKIISKEYKEIEDKIDSIVLEQDFLKIHKSLVGTYYKDYNNQLIDCGISYIERLLTCDYGRSIVYSYTQGAKKFIQSDYLSKYIKEKIKELIYRNRINTDAIKVLNSDITFNDMTCEQIRSIYYTIYKKDEEGYANTAIGKCLKYYIYKLDGKGATEFIRKYLDNKKVGEYILCTSGLIARSSYYSGRGVKRGDLNERNLIAIFGKLVKLNPNYASEYADMVLNMQTLGATEFIEAFLDFAESGFKSNVSQYNKRQISLDGLNLKSAMSVSRLAMIGMMEKSEIRDLELTKDMKIRFVEEIDKVLKSINPGFNYVKIYKENNIEKSVVR